jgi:hypothetical protein
MLTRDSSHRVIPVNHALALRPEPGPPIEVAEVIREVANGAVEGAINPAEAIMLEQPANVVAGVEIMDADAFGAMTIGTGTKKRYKGILTQLARHLKEKKLAGMDTFSDEEISASAVDILNVELLSWEDINEFSKTFFYITRGTVQTAKTPKYCANLGYALKWVYGQRNKMPVYVDRFQQRLLNSSRGRAKVQAQEKQGREIAVSRGKSHLTWSGYVSFCRRCITIANAKKTNSSFLHWSY